MNLTTARYHIFSGLREDALWVEAVLLLGLVLGSFLPTMSAQTPAPQTIPAQDRTVISMTMVPTSPVPSFAAPFLRPENPGKSAAPFSHVFSRAYERDPGLEGLNRLSPIREVKTLFLTQSMLPLLQLWGGRLRLDGFTSTLHMQNVQLGPSAAGRLLDFRPQRLSSPGGPRSIGFYGVSLSFHIGRDAQIGRPGQIWQSLARIHAAVQQ